MFDLFTTRIRERATLRILARVFDAERTGDTVRRLSPAARPSHQAASDPIDTLAPSWGGHNRRVLAA